MGILMLPSELVVAILTHLGARDILIFCRTGHFARSLLKDSKLLQYFVELDVSGLDEVDNTLDFDLADRLTYVLNRERLWYLDGLGLQRRISIPVRHDHSHLHALSAGVYVLGDLGLQPDTLRTNSLRYVRLPRCLHQTGRPLEPQDWWTPKLLGIEALSFGVSLEEQDLLAVLTTDQEIDQDVSIFHLHLKSFARETVHPHAQVPIITVHEHSGEGNHCVASIQIAGPYLVLLLTWLRSPSTSDELYVYDWTIGHLIDHKSAPGSTYRGVSFLSCDSFVLTDIRQNTLEFLQIARSSDNIVGLCLQDIGKLRLPHLREGSSIVSMTCRTDAIQSARSPPSTSESRLGESPASIYRSSSDRRYSSGLVRCKSEKALVKFRMYVQSSWPPVPEHVSHFSFVACRGELLRIARAGLEGRSTVDLGGEALPWHLWGLQYTRWGVIDEADAAWMGSVSGQRQAVVSGNKPRKIKIRDYNVYTVRKHLTSFVNDARVLSQVVTTSSTISHQGCFAEDIRSSLPYVEFVSSEGYDYDAVQLADDHIIGVLENEDDGTLRQLDVFVVAPNEPKSCGCNESSPYV